MSIALEQYCFTVLFAMPETQAFFLLGLGWCFWGVAHFIESNSKWDGVSVSAIAPVSAYAMIKLLTLKDMRRCCASGWLA
jgi:hypothetical protein